MVSRALFLLFLSAFACVSADAPDCGESACHKLAYCEGTVANPICVCQPGTIDKSANKDGSLCDTNGWSVRFVGTFDLAPLGIVSVDQFASVDAATAKAYFCADDAEGYFAQSVRLGLRASPHNMTFPSMVEVNCIYSYDNKPTDLTQYGPIADGLGTVKVVPAVYLWTLPTTDEPLRIPPTGMTVDSVHFEPSCAESGCWVIKGIMTTGEAFNDYSAFNTFFLPQADISGISPTGDLSYDYDYSAVDWTFEVRNHPCTSAAYNAGESTNEKISTCCIDYPGEDTQGGFVPNYRPTQAFVDWAGELRCDDKWIDVDGNEVCWKFYKDWTHWPTASRRCEAAGGYLVTIPDEATNTKLRQFLDERNVAQSWIGLRHEEDTYLGDFLWDDGKTPVDTNFMTEKLVSHTLVDCGPSVWLPDTVYNVTGETYSAEMKYICQQLKYALMVEDGTWELRNQFGSVYDANAAEEGFHNPYVCQFDPPTECISHVVQRPYYSAPQPEESTCLEVRTSFGKWAEAQADCAKDGGNLVSVKDEEDIFFLKRIVEGHAPPITDLAIWVGLSDQQTEGTWTWSDDSDAVNDAVDAAFYEWDYYTDIFEYRFVWDEAIQDWDWEDYSVEWVDTLWGDDKPEEYDCIMFEAHDAVFKPTSCNAPAQYVCRLPRVNATTCDDDLITADDPVWDIPFPLRYQTFLDVGKFKGMNASPGVTKLKNLDPFFGQFSFEIKLDEVELRSKAGQLRGTVGVEHTVDTFLGLANFRPTGIAALDTFATQTNLHLEKTSFFSVSTHGVNHYTFLEYVNLRLVAVYKEDADFSGAEEATDRTVRTNPDGAASYVQVTFTLGAQYAPNGASGGLIPVDSVRAGVGTFFEEVEAGGGMEEVCAVFAAALDAAPVGLAPYTHTKKTFTDRLAQPCGPQAAMCTTPGSVPDQFVSYNIPLGVDVFANKASSDLSSNVFVDLVVNALDTDPSTGGSAGPTPNQGDDPMQMKTTLTASIPIVAGGINVFCDGFTAKTDLKDVANVDIVVGTASSGAELTRLRILEDVASTELAREAAAEMDTVSIEAALMTMVLKGNASYFAGAGSNTGDYTLELDDVITLHLMEDGAAATTSKEAQVQALLDAPADDNSNAGGLVTDGYALNGAFFFTINRAEGTASLEPSAGLLGICPFNPPRPMPNNGPVETCVLRRDVQRRSFPARPGSLPTAMELLASRSAPSPVDPRNSMLSTVTSASAALDAQSDESKYMVRVLGDSAYTRQLAQDFAKAINGRYDLNGRYRRAFWINPGYEWTPTQTAGSSPFSVSQKIFLFALISLDENWSAGRRVLLQSSISSDSLEEQGAGLAAQTLSFSGVSPRSTLANTFGVPASKVALFHVELALSNADACNPSVPAQQAALRSRLDTLLRQTASPIHTVQVTRLQVLLGEEVCSARRALASPARALLAASSASAKVQMLVVFKEETRINVREFGAAEGVKGIEADPSNAPSIDTETAWLPLDFSDQDEGGSSGPSVTLIAGVCGGVGALVILVAGGVVYMRQRQREPEVVEAVQHYDLNALKTELQTQM